VAVPDAHAREKLLTDVAGRLDARTDCGVAYGLGTFGRVMMTGR
jgi:hypothetical protein